MRNFEEMTKKELCKELYKLYILSGVKPIGSSKPLSLADFSRRYLNGCGACKGFKKDELISLLKIRLEESKSY